MLSLQCPAKHNHSPFKYNFIFTIRRGLIFILLLLFGSFFSYAARNASGNILILHSYHPSFKWDIEINEGIKSVLDASEQPYQVVMEYMDSKRKADSLSQQKLFDLFLHKYEDINFDIIIASDDDALSFILKFGEDLFPGVPVVFCGVNRYNPMIKQSHPNITGVIEHLDLQGTVEEALKIFPSTTRIYFVGDHSTTARDLSHIFKNEYQHLFPKIEFHYLHEARIAHLLLQLEDLPDNSLVMLWPYLMQEGNLILNVESATRTITSASKVPVFGFWHFMLNNGIVGGKLLSGNAQGMAAAELTLDILGGKSPQDIPVRDTITNDFYFDYQVMKKFSLSNEVLPHNSILVNVPPSFIKRNIKTISGFVLAMILFAFIYILQSISNKRLRRVLRRELNFQHELIDALPNPVFYTLDNHLIEDCNRAFEKLTGYNKEDITGKEIPSFYVPGQVELHRKINEEVLLTHKPATYEGQIVVNGDNVRDVFFYKSVIFNKRTRKYGIIETIVDITDKKLAVERTRRSEERYALATKATRDGIWDWNLRKKEFYSSARLKEILGYSEEEFPFTHFNFQNNIHPSDLKVFAYQLELLSNEAKESFSIELRMKQKNGKYLWVEIKVFALLDQNKEVYRLVGSISNIQSRKDNEKWLKRWEEIFNSTRMGVATMLPGTDKTELWNPVFAQLHGYSHAELADKSLSQLVAPEYRKDISEILAKVDAYGHYVTESLHLRKDGVFFPVMVDISAVKSTQNEVLYYIINLQDITHRKIQETKITQMLQNEQVMNEELRSSEEEVRQTLQQTVTLKEKLEEYHKQFLSFVDGTSDFAILKDHKLRYVLVNDAFASFYNQTPKQLIGKTDEEVTPLWIAEFEHEMDLKVLKELKPLIYEGEFDGRYFETRKFPVSFENNVTGVGAFIRDITKQKIIEQRVQENELRFKTLLENSFDLITLTDPNGIILYCTDAVGRLTGFTNQQVVGKHFSQFFHPEDRAVFAQKLEKVTTEQSEPAHIQHRVKHVSQGYKNVETIATNHLNNPLIKAIVFTSRDVSVEMQSRELKKNIALAQKSAEIKQQFLATMSHEIRTPMNGIVGMIEFLMKTPLNETQDDYVKTIKYSADSLLNIINDILDFSKIEAGKLTINPTPVNLKSFFSDAPKIFAALLKQKNLELSLFLDESLPVYLSIDPLRLNQVLSNLLSNAIKFTPEGIISLRVFPDSIGDTDVVLRVEVQDSGIGISEEEQKVLFKPFIQIDSSLTRSIEGTGLGLTISQRIVELMGGEIGVISAPGKGSMFWFTVAGKVTDLQKTNSITQTDENLPPLHLNLNVLLVEDKIVNQKVIKLMLESLSCKVTIASNGKEAIELLEKQEHKYFDAILMDIQMPVMDGITATGIIRERFPENRVIIGLSANVISSDIQEFLSYGLDDYIIKPASSEDLHRKLFYWSQRYTAFPSSDEEETRKLISELERVAVVDSNNMSDILSQSQNNPVVLSELFSTFYNEAKDIVMHLKEAIKDENKDTEAYIQALIQMAQSMGALQIISTCEMLSKSLLTKSPASSSLMLFLQRAIRNYAEEVVRQV